MHPGRFDAVPPHRVRRERTISFPPRSGTAHRSTRCSRVAGVRSSRRDHRQRGRTPRTASRECRMHPSPNSPAAGRGRVGAAGPAKEVNCPRGVLGRCRREIPRHCIHLFVGAGGGIDRGEEPRERLHSLISSPRGMTSSSPSPSHLDASESDSRPRSLRNRTTGSRYPCVTRIRCALVASIADMRAGQST